MDAKRIYDALERDFIKEGLSDDWAKSIDGIEDFISEGYRKRWMGVMCDFSADINKVYTAVFPSTKVMQKVLDSGERDIMLFVHHPAGWKLPGNPSAWRIMGRELLEKFRERRISIYNLHVPLDNFGEYSTSYTLSRAMGMEVAKPITPYFGSLSGVMCTTNLGLKELVEQFEDLVGHEVRLYRYGDDKIRKVAVIAGGGNILEEYEGFVKDGVNLLLTGVSVKNDRSIRAHEEAERKRISILGGTHYSTEKFACMSMVYYFKKLGIDSEFLPDEPCLEDL